MPSQSRSEHILELAKELLDDIELGRMSVAHVGDIQRSRVTGAASTRYRVQTR
jgi:hypothetical protein